MKNFYAILTFLFLVSCSTSSDVVQHGFIQKRKYTKGFTHHKKDRSLFKKNSFSINKKTNEIVNDVQNPLKKLQSGIPSVTANEQKKTPEATALIASNNNDILINTDELLKENYFIKNDMSELIQIKNKPFKKIRAIKEIIELTNDGDDEAKDKSKRNFILNLLVPGLGTMLNGKIGLGILQLLLFAAGIFGAYWIFWNTSIHTIFPILISVIAYGLSAYDGYVTLKPEKALSTSVITKLKQAVKSEEDNNKIKEINSKEVAKSSRREINKAKRLELKEINKAKKIELQKLKEEVLKIPELKKLKAKYTRNLVFGSLFITLAYFLIPAGIMLSLGILLLWAIANVYGTTSDDTNFLIFSLIAALLISPLFILLMGGLIMKNHVKRKAEFNEKLNEYRKKKSAVK